jgi:DNA uptake protein ComE-like DNA-binding protein
MSRRLIALFAGATLSATLAACGGGGDAATDTATPTPGLDTAATGTGTVGATATGTATGTVGAGVVVPAGAASGVATTSGAMLDPNTATRDQLAAVPGMNAQAAEALVAGRPYADMVAVDRALAKALPDTGARKQVYAQVWQPIDLNKASDAEILLIPGIGRRMLHEFKEYRPYRDMARFRREIGKYVDEAEVARLEKYVSVRCHSLSELALAQ